MSIGVGIFTEMSSFPETKIDKWLQPPQIHFLLKYHRLQISRVYPKGSRIDSSNYDAIKMWNSGIQMVALNYQTADRAMQLNEGKFMQNGRCGYILRPEFMFHDDFDPYDRSSLASCNVEPLALSIRVSAVYIWFFLLDSIVIHVRPLQIIAARHLTKLRKSGVVCPFVEVEVTGADYDSTKCKTQTIRKLAIRRNFAAPYTIFITWLSIVRPIRW